MTTTIATATTVTASRLTTAMGVRMDGAFRKVQEVTAGDGTVRVRLQGFRTPFTFTPGHELNAR